MSPTAIRAPHWTHPALLDASRTFQVVLEPPPSPSPTIRLVSDGTIVPVRVEDTAKLQPETAAYTCTALGGRAGEVYDLKVETNRQRTVMPHAVGVIPHHAETLTLLHCSDLHLLQPTPDHGLRDRSAHIAALVARINALFPELVVCTGDLITRYDAQKRALPAELVRWQIQRVAELLARIAAPLFVTVGNHDVAFEATRGDWYSAMGGGWRGSTDEFRVDWGPYHLAMMDCFAHYDPQNVSLRSSFTAEQLAWLRSGLLAASASQLRLVFAHYDYHGQLPALLSEGRIDLLFYGHSGRLYPQELARNGVWDGHLAGTEAYNLVRLTPCGIFSQKGSWPSLTDQRTRAPLASELDR